MQTILIPTDFRPAAIDAVSSLCSQFKDIKINLIFVHIFNLSDSITDLLMLSRRSREYSFVSEKFSNGCDELKKNQRNINSIKIDFFYGSTSAAFSNYLDSNAVSLILDPANCSISKLNKFSIDPTRLIIRSGYPIIDYKNRLKASGNFLETVQTKQLKIKSSLT